MNMDPYQLYCPVCEKTLSADSCWDHHITSDKHKFNLFLYNVPIQYISDNILKLHILYHQKQLK